jgi:hypothetical protein
MTAPYSPPLWQVWNNPIVRRYATARLRLLPVLGWSLFVQPLAAFLWLVVYFASNKGASIEHAAIAAWTPILVLQGLLWLLKGTFSVAVGIAREGAEGLTETQRLTPLSAAHKVVGYLLGLPILETVLVVSLLPWTVISVVMGHVPVAVVFRVHLLLATSALLHHSIGLVAGTVIRQKIVAGTVSQLLVITLHMIVPLFARFGLGPLGHLGVEKAIAAELLTLQGLPGTFSRVRFFDFDLSLSGYAWVVMVVLIGFLVQILWRRWRHAEAHLFSKPLALAFSAWIILMSLGELFPLLRDGTLFDWGNRLASKAQQGHAHTIPIEAVSVLSQGLIPLGWAGAFGCVALLSAMILAAIITPTLEQHGRARRARLGDSPLRVPWASDAQSALGWTAVLGVMALAGWAVLVERLLDTPLLRFVLHPSPELPLTLGVGLLIPLVTWAILLEWRGLKIACLGAFLLWIVPVMVAVVGILAGTNPLHWPRWWLGLSGFALPFYSISQSMHGLADLGGILEQFRVPWIFSLAGHAVLAGVMYVFLRRAQSREAAGPLPS